MKRALTFVLALVFAISFIACEKAPFLTLNGPQSLIFPSAGGSQSITFSANREWIVSSSEPWFRITPSSGSASKEEITVMISCEANNTYGPRTASFLITMEDQSAQISIEQIQNDAIILKENEQRISYKGGNVQIDLDTNIDIEVSCSSSWVHQQQTKALSPVSFIFSVDENQEYEERRAIITIKQQNGTVQESYTIIQEARPPTPEFVDLGLSVCWASWNLGASKSEEFGDYFAWGEVETKEDFSWETYKWCNGTYKSLTKYCVNSAFGIVDNKTELEPEDDAATAILGDTWRIPTAKEWGELREICTSKEESVNGVDCVIVTSKLNGNSIVLPKAGSYWNATKYQPSSCDYWSSTLWGKENTCDAYAASGNGYGTRSRSNGIPIRPVSTSIVLKKTIQDAPAGGGVLEVSVLSSSGLDVIPEVDWIHFSGENQPQNSILLSFEPNTTGELRKGTVKLSTDSGESYRQLTFYQQKQYTFTAEEVDMGLSVKWSAMNLGAASPEEYGAYFAWGETTPSASHAGKYSYKWCELSRDGFALTKYNLVENAGLVDKKDYLDDEDDAAAVLLEGNWRMPRKKDFDELVTNSNWAKTQVNGIEGYLATSKINGNTLFFPFVGFIRDDGYMNAGECGYYLSSSNSSDCKDESWYSSVSWIVWSLYVGTEWDVHAAMFARQSYAPIRPVKE